MKKQLLLVSPVDISSKILGPVNNESGFAKILSTIYPLFLIIGISIKNFSKRKEYVRKTFGEPSSDLIVIVLPIFETKYLVLVSYVLFAFVSSAIFIFLHVKHGIKSVFIRTNSSATMFGLIAGVLNVRVFYRAISTPFNSHENGGGKLPGVFSKFYSFVMRIFDISALATADYIAVSSPGAKELILTELMIPSEKIFFLPYHIPDFLKPVEIEPKPRLNRIELVYFGSMNEYYFFDDLLKAIKELNIAGVNVKFSIFGNGPLLSHVSYLVDTLDLGGKVNIHSPVERESVPNLVKEATASVIPYSKLVLRGVSLKSIESMALGLPVIISKPAETVYVNYENCIVLSSESVNGWKEAILALENEETWERLRCGGLQTARMFRKDKILATVNSILEKTNEVKEC